MPHGLGGAVLLCACATVLVAALTVPAGAQHIWSGLSKSFVKPDGVDGSLPQYQDEVAPGVVLARAETLGLYNAAAESGWSGSGPAFTLWATDLIEANEGKTITAANKDELTFVSWIEAYGFLIGLNYDRPAVMQITFNNELPGDDIYLDFHVTSWTDGHQNPRGGWSHLRSVLPGDFNGDGRVDAGDYVYWRNRLGEPVPNPGDGADIDQSGYVDVGDYLEWKLRYGDTVPLPPEEGFAAAAPEPAGVWLLVVDLGILQWTLVRRRAIRN